MRRAAAAAIVVAGAFALYHSTLLPGFDFGDTGSFQATVGSAITPRDGYPLYFAIGQVVLWLTRADPAHALNLASAVEAALACGLIVLAAEELSGSLLAAVASAAIFAGSYTFWSQAVIAEVYALHTAFVAATLLLLLRWQRRPSAARLGAFFAAYALGFGNHLSMVLLAPAYAAFLLTTAPRGWRSMLAPRIVGLAVLCAGLGAVQYVWNWQALWLGPQPAHGVLDALARFWFEVTKSDWRETMVLHVPRSMLADRSRMYWFDLTQQFGPLLPGLAAIGLGWIVRTDWRRGALMSLLYAVNMLFAYGYNVGDTHVFYLPSHLCVALLVAPGLAALGSALSALSALTGVTGGSHLSRQRLTALVATAAAIYGAVQAYRDYPALDRSDDRRPTAVIAGLTTGLDDRRSILLTDLNWQIQNGLSYFGKEVRPGLAYMRLPDALLYAPVLVQDNLAIDRDVTATERARQQLASAYGPLLPSERDTRVPAGTLGDLVGGLAPGTRYALCVLRPTREFTVDAGELAGALRILSGGAADRMPAGDYAVVLGRAGSPPALAAGSNDPFRREVSLDGTPVEIRMESWLSADTIRRMGFGHIVAARRHTLILERGVSFAAFDAGGLPLRSGYEDGIFAPQPRYLISMPTATR